MVTREELRAHWNEVKNRLHQNWRELSETELSHFNGTPNELVGAIERKTGATRNEIEAFLQNVLRDGESVKQRVASFADQYGNELGQQAREGYEQVAAATADYSKKVVRSVQRRPIESLAIAFGVGIAAGALMLMNNRRR